MSESVADLSEALKRFGTADYAVFISMLIVCSFVGLFFGYKDHTRHKANKSKQRRGSEALEYLLGGKNVQVFPGKLFLKLL
jgi:solute carrier family 5 (sodium-coupled monocarboxylate transporter), member 8/12